MDKRKNRVSDADFMAALDAHVGRKLCWDAGKYLGSMLYFYFGRRVPKETPRGLREGSQVELAIYDCQWKILLLDAVILTSDTVGPDFGLPEHVQELFIGSAIEGFKRIASEKACVFTFTNDLALMFDTSNKHKADSSIAEVRLHGNSIYEFSPGGQVFHIKRTLQSGEAPQ